jgi:hypothetical protein
VINAPLSLGGAVEAVWQKADPTPNMRDATAAELVEQGILYMRNDALELSPSKPSFKYLGQPGRALN